VSRRTREVGIRMSLGATPPEVVKLLMRGGLWLVIAGSALGVVLALILTPLVQSFLIDVGATDLATFVLVTALLLGVAALAAWMPARRAAGIDPMEALRTE
jgi:ABC-type antimicrobial peptide transport system permease subunit